MPCWLGTYGCIKHSVVASFNSESFQLQMLFLAALQAVRGELSLPPLLSFFPDQGSLQSRRACLVAGDWDELELVVRHFCGSMSLVGLLKRVPGRVALLCEGPHVSHGALQAS